MNILKVSLISILFMLGVFSSFSCLEKGKQVSDIDIKEIKSAEDAISTAKKNKIYLFLCFYEKNDEALLSMEKEVEAFRKDNPAKSFFYKTPATNTKDAELVKKYGLDKVKLPAVLVFAPNGVITGGFPEKVTRPQLEGTIATTLDLDIMKVLQEDKIALVLIQNGKTKSNKESTDSAEEFKNDSTVKDLVGIVIADPSVKENKNFLTACKLDEKVEEASIVVIVPPGAIAGVFKGKTDKSIILNSLKGGTCGPAGCDPATPGCEQ